jgi:hypothetical protein
MLFDKDSLDFLDRLLTELTRQFELNPTQFAFNSSRPVDQEAANRLSLRLHQLHAKERAAANNIPYNEPKHFIGINWNPCDQKTGNSPYKNNFNGLNIQWQTINAQIQIQTWNAQDEGNNASYNVGTLLSNGYIKKKFMKLFQKVKNFQQTDQLKIDQTKVMNEMNEVFPHMYDDLLLGGEKGE